MDWLLVPLFLGVPFVASALEARLRVARALGSVLICYAAGLLVALWVPVNPAVASGVATVAVALAIPLLLFSLDLAGWWRLAGRTVLSFGLAVVSVAAAGMVAHGLFRDRVENSAAAIGMLMGVYTGGTPNMAAIGVALHVPPETFLVLNAADIVVSSLYLAFLLSLAPRWYAGLLRPFRAGADERPDETAPSEASLQSRVVALAGGIVAAGVGVGPLAGEDYREATTILVISTLAVAASLSARVRSLPGTFELGHYFLLVFCVAIGSSADFAALAAGGAGFFAMTAVVLVTAAILHLVLAIAFRIDRDTLIITNTASIFGPAFVGPVALAIRNRRVILSGVITGLVGYAIGNYLGLGMAWFLRTW